MALTVATYEQILTILTQLAQNYTNLFDVYYEMFYDQNPQDVVLKIYDQNGQQQSISLPNRAKDKAYILNGEGNPNSVVTANRGSIYQDLTNGTLYINTDGTVEGWVKLVSSVDLSQIIMQGYADPEGNVTAGRGVLYTDARRGMLYIKTTETGNTGWINVSAAFEDLANVDLDNLSTKGLEKFANPALSNINTEGQARFANPSLSNLNGAGQLRFNEKENLSNKTQNIDENSTTDQYPSAKSVYDIVKNLTPAALTGQTGKFLTNDGTELEWEEIEVEVPVGCIQYSGRSTRPDGWLVCDGSAIPRDEFANLFEAIGTTFGAGDGSTTFNLPNLIDKFPQGNTTVGTEVTAGLPNIVGEFISGSGAAGTARFGNSGGAISGAFYKTSTAGGRVLNETNNAWSGSGLGLDASLSSSIYGNSNTVQPPALTLLPIIKY